MLELPSLDPSISQSSIAFFDFHWPFDSLVRDPLLITGDNHDLAIVAAVVPLLEQLVARKSEGGILLSIDRALPLALEAAASRAGRQSDLCIFRTVPHGELFFSIRPARFNLLSCQDVAPDDYARILLEPTVGERIREACLGLTEQAELAGKRGRAEIVLSRGITLAREQALVTCKPMLLSCVIDALEQSGELDLKAHRFIYDRFAPLLWDESLAALFCGAQPNTVSIEEVVNGSKLVAFDLPPAHGAAEYAATVIKRLAIHLRMEAAWTQSVRHPMWLLAEANAAFLEAAELGIDPDGLRSVPVEAAMAVIVCAASPRLAAMCLGGCGTRAGFAAVAAIPNRIMFRPPRSEILIAHSSGEPDDAYTGIDGVDATRLSALGDRSAYCARRGEPAQLVRIERLPGEGRMAALANCTIDAAGRAMPWIQRTAA